MAPSLDSTLGAILIGCVVSSIFYGITSLQVFFYFNNSASDKLLYRVSVAILWVLDTIHLAFVVYFLYNYTVTQPGMVFIPDWSSAALVIMTNISNLLIRLIFIYRIWFLCERKGLLLITPLSIIVVCTAVLGNFYGIRMRTLAFSDISRISWALYATLSGDVLADVGITLSLCVLFRRMQSGIKRTDTFLNILILYTINTGLLTSAVAIGTLVTYAIMPNNYIFMGIFFVLSKAAFNSLLATLNARTHLRSTTFTINPQEGIKSPTIPSFGPGSLQVTLVDDGSQVTGTTYSQMGIAV